MAEIPAIVQKIIEDVRSQGDTALCEMAQDFDGVSLAAKDLRVSERELAAAESRVSPEFIKALKECARSIEKFALLERRRLTKSWMGRSGAAQVGQLIRPVDSVGLYIPGGRFPYPSTVLMSAIPAKVAGVKRIVITSPSKNMTPEVLSAAFYVGCREVYRVGGAGAIAALAYGTESIPKVDFIVGPGNAYVTEAKRQVFGRVGIDSLAGPSEVVIIADRYTPVEFIESDLMAQAEHDPEARSLFISTDKTLLGRVAQRLERAMTARIELRHEPRLEKAIEIANEIGPEHLELLFRGARRYLAQVRHAGAIFLGPATTAVLGDYVAGPSHVLPTRRAARYASGLSVATFMKRSSVIEYAARPSEKRHWEAALTMAQTEGMEHHGRSLRARVSP
jgi:histidinol dehydrogenase